MKKYRLMIMVEDDCYSPCVESANLIKLKMIKRLFEKQGYEVDIEDYKTIEERRKNYKPLNYNLPEEYCVGFVDEITGDISDVSLKQTEV